MLPYIAWHTINIGPVHLQVWGLFVGLGFLLGAYMAAWLAQRRGQNPAVVYDSLPWLIIAGLVGGRLGYVVFYEPAHFIAHPLEIFALWQGGSSMFGGLIACLVVGVWYLRRRRVDILAYADTLVFGLPFGIWLGRIGCFLIHDHPGTVTNFFLGATFPDGVVRHDLGLYESLAGLILALVFLWLARRARPLGTYLVIFAVAYGWLRFGLDFLRTTDVRYFGLTPAQYLALVLAATGLGVAVWIRKRPKNVQTSTLAPVK